MRDSAFGLNCMKAIIGVVTDGAAIMRRFGRLLDIEHHQCLLMAFILPSQTSFTKVNSVEVLWTKDTTEMQNLGAMWIQWIRHGFYVQCTPLQ